MIRRLLRFAHGFLKLNKDSSLQIRVQSQVSVVATVTNVSHKGAKDMIAALRAPSHELRRDESTTISKD